MEKKNILILAIVAVAVIALGIGLWVWSSKSNDDNYANKSNPSGSEIILFYSTSCPHCKKVEQFMAENNVEDKIVVKQLEVSGSQSNAKKFFETAKGCGIDQDNAGVPLLFSEGKCYQGDSDIINFLKEKM